MITQIQIKVPAAMAEYYRCLPVGQRSAAIRRAIDYMLHPSGVEDVGIDEGVQQDLQQSKWAIIKKGTACTPLNVYIDLTQRQRLIWLSLRLNISMSALIRLALELAAKREANKT